MATLSEIPKTQRYDKFGQFQSDAAVGIIGSKHFSEALQAFLDEMPKRLAQNGQTVQLFRQWLRDERERRIPEEQYQRICSEILRRSGGCTKTYSVCVSRVVTVVRMHVIYI